MLLDKGTGDLVDHGLRSGSGEPGSQDPHVRFPVSGETDALQDKVDLDLHTPPARIGAGGVVWHWLGRWLHVLVEEEDQLVVTNGAAPEGDAHVVGAETFAVAVLDTGDLHRRGG